MNDRRNAGEPLRVVLLTCSLGLAGAEKQAYYITQALFESGVEVRLCTVMRGGEYRDALRRMGILTKHIGWRTPPLRMTLLLSQLAGYRPHVIQSMNAYLNGYAAVAGKILNAISVGGLRSDVPSFLRDHGRFARLLLNWPDGLAVNSRNAIEEAEREGLPDLKKVYFLPNAIDASAFPERRNRSRCQDCNCLWVGRLVPAKRADVFLRALAAAREIEPGIRGTLVGYGPQSEQMRQLAATLGLFPDGLKFLGFRDDVAGLLLDADVLVFSSESEGTPNVILEAMAASLPVITTPAGDAADLVQGAGSGYVVPFGSVDTMAEMMVRLARSPAARLGLGKAAREHVVHNRGVSSLGCRLLKLYAQVSQASKRGRKHPLLQRVHAGPAMEPQISRPQISRR